MITKTSITFNAEAISPPVIIAYIIVSEAPMPTQTAYEVPTANSRMAYERPDMLSTSAIRNMAEGHGRENPSERLRALAQTASSTPDTTRTSHAAGASESRRCTRLADTALDQGKSKAALLRSVCLHLQDIASGADHVASRRADTVAGRMSPPRVGVWAGQLGAVSGHRGPLRPTLPLAPGPG